MIAGLHAEEHRQARLLVERRQVRVRHQARTYVTARERQAIHRGSEVEAVVLLVEPAVGEEAADEAVDRAFRRIQGARKLGKGHARTVDHTLEDARDAIHRAVALWYARTAPGRRAISACALGVRSCWQPRGFRRGDSVNRPAACLARCDLLRHQTLRLELTRSAVRTAIQNADTLCGLQPGLAGRTLSKIVDILELVESLSEGEHPVHAHSRSASCHFLDRSDQVTGPRRPWPRGCSIRCETLDRRGGC